MPELQHSLFPSPQLPEAGDELDLEHSLHEEIQRCIATLRDRLGIHLPPPAVHVNIRGTMAGQARIDDNQLRFNPQLLHQYGDQFIRDTVPHEVAHLAAYKAHGRRIRPHGPEWKSIMRVLGADASRCHNYAVQPTRQLQRYRYRCRCREHELTSIRHKRAQRGTRYICTDCGTRLRRGCVRRWWMP